MFGETLTGSLHKSINSIKNVMLVALITDLKHFFRFVTLVFRSGGMVRYLMLDHTLPWLPDIIQRGTGF